MLYSFLTSFIDQFSFLNVFKYLTFRTGLALMSSLIIVFFIGGPFIKFLSKKKITGPIRKDGPISHIVKKVGTPTMGGVVILIGLLSSTLLWADLTNVYIWFLIFVASCFGILGAIDDLIELGLWNEDMKQQLIAANGSVQDVRTIPQSIKDLYKTVWEIKQKQLIDMAADRGAYIDQSQSFNVHIQDPNFGKLTSMHFYSWKKGLKTGMYYLRTKAATDAIKFTIDQSKEQVVTAKSIEKSQEDMACSIDNPEDCEACGS